MLLISDIIPQRSSNAEVGVCTKFGAFWLTTLGFGPKVQLSRLLMLPSFSAPEREFPLRQHKPYNKFLVWLTRHTSRILGSSHIVAATNILFSSAPYRAWVFRKDLFQLSDGLLSAILAKRPEIFLSALVRFLDSQNLFSHIRYIRMLTNMVTASSFTTNHIPLVGVRFFVCGKISVSGNARTRSMGMRWGLISRSRLYTNSFGSWDIVKTNTGCLGLFVLLYI